MKTALFDFDGTIADTMPALEAIAVPMMVDFYGLSQGDAEREYRRTAGLPFIAQLEELFPRDEVNVEAAEQFEQQKPDVYARCQPFSEAYEALRELRRQGIRTGVVSSTRSQLVYRFLAKHEFYVDWASGISRGTKAEQITLAMTELPSPAVFYGDSPLDEGFAIAAGVGFVAVCRPGQPKFASEQIAQLGEVCQANAT